MDAIMTIGEIAGALVVSLCAALGIEWIFLAGAFRWMSGAMARTPEPQPVARQRCIASRRPALWS